MKLVNLASGSKGNSTLIYNDKVKLLVDIGLSYKEMVNRLSILNISPEEISIICITHEHSDHIKGLKTFVKNHPNVYIYIHSDNYHNLISKSELSPDFTSRFIPMKHGLKFRNVSVYCFKVNHDSNDCVGFRIEDEKNKVAVATDLGCYNMEIVQNLINCSHILIECNHDVEMLKSNPMYPAILKSRILSDNGHLSNIQCAELCVILAKNSIKHLILSHLSEENNTPELALNTVNDYLIKNGLIPGVDVFVDLTYQSKIGEIYIID